MVRLCSKSSRPYSGRPATRARQQWRGRRSAMAVVREQESAEAIVPGVTSRKTAPDGLTTREGLNLAGRHDHRWSCPGAMRPNRLSCGQRSSWQRKSAASFRKDCQEPPYADPHVRWCGSREGQNPPGDPIGCGSCLAKLHKARVCIPLGITFDEKLKFMSLGGIAYFDKLPFHKLRLIGVEDPL